VTASRGPVSRGSVFYLVNLILAIVAMSYDDCQKQAQEEAAAEEALTLVCNHRQHFYSATRQTRSQYTIMNAKQYMLNIKRCLY